MDVDHIDNTITVEDDFTREQRRIKNFIDEATTIEQLDGLDGVELSQENYDLLKEKKNQILTPKK
jgi:hypothetical protein